MCESTSLEPLPAHTCSGVTVTPDCFSTYAVSALRRSVNSRSG